MHEINRLAVDMKKNLIPFSGFMSRIQAINGLKGTKARQWAADFFGLGVATIYRYEQEQCHVIIDERAKKTTLLVEKTTVNKIL